MNSPYCLLAIVGNGSALHRHVYSIKCFARFLKAEGVRAKEPWDTINGNGPEHLDLRTETETTGIPARKTGILGFLVRNRNIIFP